MDEVSYVARRAGLELGVREFQPAASLRYLSANGALAAAVQAATGQGLPAAGRLVAAGACWLAWRSPTETIVVAEEPGPIERLVGAVGEQEDGCALELSGALAGISLAGPALAELICRLGGPAPGASPGEACRVRLADVAVLILCPRPQTVQLLIERPLCGHLLGWIRETVLDLA
ncbi:MAG: hypothetical protein JO341_03240 [Gammaproteobacteria bacterium]|nr:hypothetical protein [Gammaproteobacteria bacterium]MBV9620015.1 hypothetical protein [Gammaproteobacteria bacterium]